MSFILQPGEKMPQDKLEQLQLVNEKYSQTGDFPKYLNDLKQIFPVQDNPVTTEAKFYLGGFLEGEGSLSVSAKKLKTAKFGILVDPEFTITQHVNGFENLYLALKIFQTGRIRHKSGSNATLVLTIDCRQNLEQKVVPFYESYVIPFGSVEKAQRLKKFNKCLDFFKSGVHKDKAKLITQMLPLWDEMRRQKGQSNETFKSLQDAQNYVRDFEKTK